MKGLFGIALTLVTQKVSISGMKKMFASLDNILILINLIVFHKVIHLYVEKCSGLEYI